MAGSCDVGQYDLIGITSLAEELVLLRDAGSILSIAATRSSFSAPNFYLFYPYLNYAVNNGIAPGIALMLAKQRSTDISQINDSYSNILGDPFLKVQYPTVSSNIEFESEQEELKIRQTVSLTGNFDHHFSNNTVSSLVYDSGSTFVITVGTSTPTALLSKNNLPIFKGSSTLSGDTYRLNFIIPDDAQYGNKTRIYSLAFNTQNQTFVNMRNGISILPEKHIVNNTDRPDIKIFIDNEKFREGDKVQPYPTLYARISDENGLNTTGTNGHHIMIYVERTKELIPATTGFEYEKDSYTEGLLTWKLNNLPSGKNTVMVVAYDSFNEHSVGKTSFVTSENVPIKIKNPLVYPNPVKQNGAHFTFELTHEADININIYTITGRKIRSLSRKNLTAKPHHIFWDGRDEDGHKLANNTYFYTIKATVSQGKGTSEVREKFVVLK
jgi:hypothetical protein